MTEFYLVVKTSSSEYGGSYDTIRNDVDGWIYQFPNVMVPGPLPSYMLEAGAIACYNYSYGVMRGHALIVERRFLNTVSLTVDTRIIPAKRLADGTTRFVNAGFWKYPPPGTARVNATPYWSSLPSRRLLSEMDFNALSYGSTWTKGDTRYSFTDSVETGVGPRIRYASADALYADAMDIPPDSLFVPIMSETFLVLGDPALAALTARPGIVDVSTSTPIPIVAGTPVTVTTDQELKDAVSVLAESVDKLNRLVETVLPGLATAAQLDVVNQNLRTLNNTTVLVGENNLAIGQQTNSALMQLPTTTRRMGEAAIASAVVAVITRR